MRDNTIEREIDLRDMFKIVWDKKMFIVIFTLIITLLTIVYVNMKTPVYEVKSVVKIGNVNENLLENNNVLVQKLKLIYNVGNKNYMLNEKNKAIVTNIKTIKNLDNFIGIYTQGFSNEEALKLNKDVVSFLKSEYKFKIDDFILRTNTTIKNLNISIKNVKIFEEDKIKRDIEKIKSQTLVKLDEQIKFKKDVELTTIEDKLKFYNNKLLDYEKNISKLTLSSKSNTTTDILKSIQLSNIQNLVLSIQNNILNLEKEKKEILNFGIKDLKIKKQNILTDNIKALENKLNITLPNKINSLKDKILFEENKLKNIENSSVVGEYLVYDNPIKPKKMLMIIVTFVTSFILSIFLVFILKFFNSLKREN